MQFVTGDKEAGLAALLRRALSENVRHRPRLEISFLKALRSPPNCGAG